MMVRECVGVVGERGVGVVWGLIGDVSIASTIDTGKRRAHASAARDDRQERRAHASAPSPCKRGERMPARRG